MREEKREENNVFNTYMCRRWIIKVLELFSLLWSCLKSKKMKILKLGRICSRVNMRERERLPRDGGREEMRCVGDL